MKVLAFNAYYTPEIAASMYITEDIHKAIIGAGHELEVFVPMPTRGIDESTRKKYKHKKTEILDGGKFILHRISMYREGKNSVGRAFRYLLINIAFIIKGCTTKADVIFVQSTPPTQGLMAGIIKAIKHIPLVYNLQDIFPDSLVNTGLTRKGSFIWKIGRKVEDYSYKHADKIIVISQDFKDNILKKNVNISKIKIIPNWADTKMIYPISRDDNVLAKKYGFNNNQFLITYCGNVGYTQNMDMLLKAAQELATELPNIVFVIIGDGADKERIQKIAENECINNVVFLPFQPYDNIAHVFNLGDLGLIISKPGVGDNSVPSKTWNIMAARKPILASFDSKSELCQIIKNAQCGYVAEADDYEQFVQQIRKAVFSNELKKLGDNGKRYLDTYYSQEVSAKKYVEIIESVKFER